MLRPADFPVCSDEPAGEHQRDSDQLEDSECVLAAGAGCSDLPGQNPGDG